MLNERLLNRLASEPGAPDYQRIAAEELGIQNAPPALARKLVEQALLLTDWREHWRRVGERATREAPAVPGVYVFRDGAGRTLYVGKALNLRRRLNAHFTQRRWRGLQPALARVVSVDWEPLGSELEAILREAALIRSLEPRVNVQVAPPSLHTRALSPSLVRDLIVLLPSVDPNAAEVVAARKDGATLLKRATREGGDVEALATALTAFFAAPRQPDASGDAPLVYSWLAARGQHTTRIDPHDCPSADALSALLRRLLADQDLFVQRLIAR